MKINLLLAKEVSDFNGFVVVGDAGVNGKVGVDKPHLVAVALGDTGDEVVNVAEGSANGGGGFARSEPGIDLQLLLAILVGDELKIEVEMFKISHQFSTRSFHLDHFRVNFDAHTVGNVHRFGR